MNRISICEGISVAASAAIVSAAAGFILQALLGWPGGTKLNVALLGFLYLGYLLQRSSIRAGKLLFGISGTLALVAAAVCLETISGAAAAAITVIWLLRSTLYAAGLLSAAAHLTLCLLGAGLAGYALTSGSGMAGAVWCFFLLQAPWVLLPKRATPLPPRNIDSASGERFAHACTTAERALNRLLGN
jgi:hypothetical protein